MIKKLILLFFLIPSISYSQTTIEAKTYRNQSGTGSCLISNGFPLPKGLVTAQILSDKKIVVTVNGVEQAVNISPLRGRYDDNSLRSILIQFNYSMSSGTNISSSVIIGGSARSTTDISYTRPTIEIVQNNNVILPSDASYLVTTNATFQHLLKSGEGSTADNKLYDTLLGSEFDALSISENYGTAYYENTRALFSAWLRSGDIKYFNKAILMVTSGGSGGIYGLPYTTPTVPSSCSQSSIIDPDNRIGVNGSCGIPNEQYAPRDYAYASSYLLTGYRDFWSVVAYSVQRNQITITSQSISNSKIPDAGHYDFPRFSYSFFYGSLIAASMIDATIPISGGYGTGRALDFTDQLTWTVNSLINNYWDLKWIPFSGGSGTAPSVGTTISQGAITASLLGVYADINGVVCGVSTSVGNTMPSSGYLQVKNISGGHFSSGALSGISATATGIEQSDYRQGMIGSRSNSPREPGGGSPPVIPVFQNAFPLNFLIDYYLNVYADSRIPQVIKTNLDIILSQIRLQVQGDGEYGVSGGIWGDPLYGHPYSMTNPVSEINVHSWSLPEYPRIIAFVIKTLGDGSYGGTNYSTWYQRCVDTANVSPNILIWQWKIFGQYYGWGQDAPWMMAQSSLSGPSSIREPISYLTIPGDIPDVYVGESQIGSGCFFGAVGTPITFGVSGTPIGFSAKTPTPIQDLNEKLGYGKDSLGGHGGSIIHVTNLSGTLETEGTFRYAIAQSGPRTIVFDVSGNIDLQGGAPTIYNPYITIAGQTAPAPGITIINGGLTVSTHDVILEHLRIRPGVGATGQDALTIAGDDGVIEVYNVLADHCSFTWAHDENVGIGYPITHDVTIQNSIIAEGIDPDQDGDGGYGLLNENALRVSVIGNLFAHNHNRNPATGLNSITDVVNNYIYDWQWWATEFEGGLGNVINNFYKVGASTTSGTAGEVALVINGTTPPSAYVAGNIGPARTSYSMSDIVSVRSGGESYATNVAPTHITKVKFIPEVKDSLSYVGARPLNRDSVDTRIINETINGTGGLLLDEDNVGGFPALANNTSTFVPVANYNTTDEDGHTLLENQLKALSLSLITAE